MKPIQQQFVENHIRKHGSISRNYCLREYISRLSAIICDMNNKGYIIEGEVVKGAIVTRWGKQNDYVYKVKHKPKDSVYSEES